VAHPCFAHDTTPLFGHGGPLFGDIVHTSEMQIAHAPVPGACCLQATWRLITAPKESLLQTTYNVTATTFTPAELAEAIRYYP